MGRPVSPIWTPLTPTRKTWICSAKARCLSCSAPPGRTSARRLWRVGFYTRPAPKPCARASRPSRNSVHGWTCARTWPFSRRRREPVSTPSRWPPGVKRRSCWNPGSASGSGGSRFSALPPLPEGAALLLRDFFLLALLANLLFLHRIDQRVAPVVAAVEEAAHELKLVSGVLERLEREQFQSPLLARLRASLQTDGEPPSRRLARLQRLMEYLDSRDNLFVRFAEFFILWTPHVATKVAAWKRHSGPSVRSWLTALGEMEALCSLASHAFEHPQDPFPEFTAESPWFEAIAIAHPLIPDDRVVRNDVRLGGALRLLVVSGSNMSGKSTLLRTIGVNTVLAQAGAPVRASRLVLSPLTVGASIHVLDSLQNGVSRFYAEILRIRQILDLAAGSAVLFLIDEFLHGTNSHDRRIGAEALVRGLLARGAIGLITTHDLALADIVETLGPQAANVHFEDQLDGGRMRFDYVMRPGVVRKSNAIELMRSVGLEI